MEKLWKEKGIYITLCMTILLLLLITVLSSREQKNKQRVYKESVLNQDIYEIHEINQETSRLTSTNQLSTEKVEKKLEVPTTQKSSDTIKSESSTKSPTSTNKVASSPVSTSKPTSTVTSKPTPKATKTPMQTPTPTPIPTTVETKNTKTAEQAINEMKIGWNLGNSLDSCNYQKKYLGLDKAITYYETAWGNPVTTKEMITEIKKAGFRSIRVPVTYYDHIDSNGKVDSKWMQRVKEVISYVLENDMYCILDVHHDTGLYEGGSWIVADADKYQENANKLSKLWTQIALEFKDYDYKLVFEGFNEIVDTNKNYDWVSGHQNTVNVNRLNQVFVDTVRKTGGKNRDRFLVITTFGGITDEHKLSNLVMPKDSSSNKIILALHDYASTQGGIDKMLGNIKKYCKEKNIPVILDEFGTKQENMKEEQRVQMATYYVSSARKLGITCFWWDNGSGTGYRIFNRLNLSWEHPEIKNALIHNS